MLSFSLVAEALTGLALRAKIPNSFLPLPDDERSISRNVAEKHYDSRHDKLRNNMDTTESTNTNIFKLNLPVTHHSWKLRSWSMATIMVQLHSVKPFKNKSKPDARPKSNWNNVFSAVSSFSELNMVWLETAEQLQPSIRPFVSLALGL